MLGRMKLLCMLPHMRTTADLGKPPNLMGAGFHEFPVAKFPAIVQFSVFCRFTLDNRNSITNIKLRIAVMNQEDRMLDEKEEIQVTTKDQQRLTWSPTVRFEARGPENIRIILFHHFAELASWPVLVWAPEDLPEDFRRRRSEASPSAEPDPRP